MTARPASGSGEVAGGVASPGRPAPSAPGRDRTAPTRARARAAPCRRRSIRGREQAHQPAAEQRHAADHQPRRQHVIGGHEGVQPRGLFVALDRVGQRRPCILEAPYQQEHHGGELQRDRVEAGRAFASRRGRGRGGPLPARRRRWRRLGRSARRSGALRAGLGRGSGGRNGGRGRGRPRGRALRSTDAPKLPSSRPLACWSANTTSQDRERDRHRHVRHRGVQVGARAFVDAQLGVGHFEVREGPHAEDRAVHQVGVVKAEDQLAQLGREDQRDQRCNRRRPRDRRRDRTRDPLRGACWSWSVK